MDRFLDRFAGILIAFALLGALCLIPSVFILGFIEIVRLVWAM